MSTILTHDPTGSPFDAIKRTDDFGNEYWSARELMEGAGYDRWENFNAVIAKAAQSAINQGHESDHHFRGVTKVIEGGRWGNQTVQDYELSRFAAYLLFQNGDPRKPEIAAAQGYFAIRTREAEVAKPELTEIEVAERWLLALKEKQALAAKVEELEGPAAQAQTMRQAEGLRTITDLLNDLKVHAMSNYPGVKVVQNDVFDLAGRVGLIIRGNTIRNNQPTARAIEAQWVKPKDHEYESSNGTARVKMYARLTPSGYGRLWDAAIKNIREHGMVLPTLKEIAA